MSRVVVLVLVVAVAALDAGAAFGASGRWRAPLPGAVLSGAFTFDRAAPYARGVRRGIDLRGVPEARVLAACAGTVTHAGRVPRWGRGVSLRCGGLVATELGLASAAVARGARVWPGAVVGRLAPGGLLRLGARRVGDRQGYVDPLELLGHSDRSAPPPIAPRRRPAARPRPRVAPPAMLAATRPAATAPSHTAALPWLGWAGVALLAVGAGGGDVARRRHRRRRRTGMALAQR
ncbi:M23 family metallopeptidase [Baekduia sp.]|jgi:hypothetical protein|uniref:M23 family metallopeptidase n=1 Tax=Baekduia sp. TaxID=2600305 RepID=UPI002DF8FF00|nr:M23 family metallopeptidase [Baekduia sp.]